VCVGVEVVAVDAVVEGSVISVVSHSRRLSLPAAVSARYAASASPGAMAIGSPQFSRPWVLYHSTARRTVNSFWSPADAQVVISDWKHDYNHHRRHSSLGYQPPARYAATCIHQ
jgi:transposase InsO family protein